FRLGFTIYRYGFSLRFYHYIAWIWIWIWICNFSISFRFASSGLCCVCGLLVSESSGIEEASKQGKSKKGQPGWKVEGI
ncbi:hypothetical protein M422DRAFT_31974, partial [Sphaerobolus stellatus SS14]